MYVSTAKPAQLPKPGARGVFSCKWNMIKLLAWNVPQHLLLITFSIAGSRVMMNTNLEQVFLSRLLVANYIFITRNYNTYNCNFPNATNRLLYYPSLRSIQFTTQDLRGHVTSPDQGLSSTRGKRLGTRLGIKLLILANKLSFIRKTKSVTYLFYFIIISMN